MAKNATTAVPIDSTIPTADAAPQPPPADTALAGRVNTPAPLSAPSLPAAGSGLATTRVPSQPDGVTGVQPFLSMRDPKAESLVEFKEPFRVSLDSLYTSLYFNSVFEPSARPDRSGRASRAVLLDWRPKRWYREYKAVSDAMRMARFDVKRASAELAALENDGAYLPSTDKEEQDERIRACRRRYFQYREQFEALVAERNDLEREIRAAGYLLGSGKVPPAVSDLGYDFYLVGGVPAYKDFAPLQIPSTTDLGDDAAWTETEKALRERLFSNPRFSKAARALYQTKLVSLANKPAFVPSIQTDLETLDQEVALVESQQTQLRKELDDVAVEIANWTDDRAVLSDAQILFRPYSGGEYPLEGGGPGPSNNATFKEWLSTSFATLKAFGYKLNVSGANYSVSIADYPGFDWYQDYQINVASFPVEVFHPWDWFDVRRTWSPGWTERVGTRYEYRYTINGDVEIRNFFESALRCCDQLIKQDLPRHAEELKTRITTLENNKAGINLQRSDLANNSLGRARASFVDAWNSPDVIDRNLQGESVVDPNADPLADLLSDVQSEGEKPRLYRLEIRSDGYYTQEGQSLLEFARGADALSHLPILLLPAFGRDGEPVSEALNAVVNPARSGRTRAVPTVTFVETYRVSVRWNGYCLGELTQTINLFPGEKKQLTTTRTTRLMRELASSESRESEQARTDTASFEESLETELSESNTTALSSSKEDQQSRTTTATHLVADSTERVDTAGVQGGLGGSSSTNTNISADGTYNSASSKSERKPAPSNDSTGKQGAGGMTEKSNSGLGGALHGDKQNMKSEQHGFTFDARTTTTSVHRDDKTDALEISQNQINKVASQESRESFKKALSNTVRKVASEVSCKNKVSVNVSRRTTSEDTFARTETVTIENPNVGRTLNYHLFQLQNVYEVTTTLIDVKIVVDPGVEVVKSSEITDVRVFNLEEFGRIFFGYDTEDPRAALLATTVARHVFRNYCDFEMTDPSRKPALLMTDILPFDPEMLGRLNLSAAGLGAGDASAETAIHALREALVYLKGRSFKFRPVETLPAQTETINTGSFHMDAEVGTQPATEAYLEDRRNAEAQRQRVEIDELRARIQAGVFQPAWPSGLTSLSVYQGGGALGDAVTAAAAPAARP